MSNRMRVWYMNDCNEVKHVDCYRLCRDNSGLMGKLVCYAYDNTQLLSIDDTSLISVEYSY